MVLGDDEVRPAVRSAAASYGPSGSRPTGAPGLEARRLVARISGRPVMTTCRGTPLRLIRALPVPSSGLVPHPGRGRVRRPTRSHLCDSPRGHGLTREIQQLGYRGDVNAVQRHLRLYRTGAIAVASGFAALSVACAGEGVLKADGEPGESGALQDRRSGHAPASGAVLASASGSSGTVRTPAADGGQVHSRFRACARAGAQLRSGGEASSIIARRWRTELVLPRRTILRNCCPSWEVGLRTLTGSATRAPPELDASRRPTGPRAPTPTRYPCGHSARGCSPASPWGAGRWTAGRPVPWPAHGRSRP